MVYGIGNPATGGVIVPTDANDRWIRGISGRIMLTGDAAHTFTPPTGMGAQSRPP